MAGNMKFETVQDEIVYWKKMAEQYQKMHQEARDELEEFQLNSRDLEAELETQLEQSERKNRDLVSAQSQLQRDCDLIKGKYEKLQLDSHRQITELKDSLTHVIAIKDDLQKYIRELEQSNDDLERAKRAAYVSLEDFEGRLNQAFERNAFLESELDDKESLAITVQRLKDESRDLRAELQIKVRSPDSTEPDNDKSILKATSPVDSNKLITEIETHTTPLLRNLSTGSSNPLTPSARISALNIVGDLLSKVGALESKLASCRSFVKESPRSSHGVNLSPINSPRAKRVNRGLAANNAHFWPAKVD